MPAIQVTPRRPPSEPHRFADNLMAGDDVIAQRLQFALDDVQIGAAYATGADAKQDLAWRGRGNRNIADFERPGSDICGTG